MGQGTLHLMILCLSLSGKSCFSTLFKFEEMQEIVKNFTVVHVDAPGQEDGAAIYPVGYVLFVYVYIYIYAYVCECLCVCVCVCVCVIDFVRVL